MHCDLGDGEPSAYIFDAFGCAPGPKRQRSRNARSFLLLTLSPYENRKFDCKLRRTLLDNQSHNFNLNDGSDQARNPFKLISQIRAKAFEQEDPDGPLRQY